MGKYANNLRQRIVLAAIGLFVTALNVLLLKDMLLG